ncbi:hypothetical protein LAZ67_5004201 [Cordylochernes scorpioides]|uniref:Transposase Tc1-like domain-containing protein n=1 Tax=Cordylochernes scorpioides TaxID=51811 RepID=A0ABY6KKV9_9ARAC|nr:hypothetical protein LAZ67_5004201 [Cordylochernes scorpioides]
MSTYEYEIRYIKGSKQHEADLLSRNPFCGFLSAAQIKEKQPLELPYPNATINPEGLHTLTRKGVTKVIVPPSLQHTLINKANGLCERLNATLTGKLRILHLENPKITIISDSSTDQTEMWQADLAPKEMATSDKRNRRHMQLLLTWSTNTAHPVSLEPLQGHRKRRQFKQTDAFMRGMVIGLKRADRRILRQAVAAPQATCTAILQHVQDTLDHSISTRTISRRLVANGLHSCRPLRRLPLTPPNRRQRLEWCRARSTWMTEWHRVVFSDESRFCLSSDSRRVRVWRRRGERSNPAAIVERPTVRQRGIMV